MEQTSHIKQYVAVLIVGILIGAGASYMYSKKSPASPYAGMPGNPANLSAMMSEVHILTGTVTAIDGNKITLQAQPNPFLDASSPAERTVNITSDTKIVKVSSPDMKAFQAESEAYMKKIQSGKGAGVTPPMPPMPIRTIVAVSSIIKGSVITATATENIKSKKSFDATEIQVQ